jgi:hypothetical protein
MRAVALAALIVAAIPARASADTFFDEAVVDLQKKLISVDRPGLPMPLNAPRNVDKHEILPRDVGEEERPFRLFRDLQVRRSGSAAHIVGTGMPVDVVSGVLPGTLLAMRVGAESHGFGLYSIAGGGTFTAFQHVIPRRDIDPMQVETRSVPFAFFGLGSEVRLYRAVVIAGEMNWGNVIIGRSTDRVVAPAADETVRSAALALRVDY